MLLKLVQGLESNQAKRAYETSQFNRTVPCN